MWLAERIGAMLRPDCRQGNALTADALMRSRYTAFTLNNFEHIDRTTPLKSKKISTGLLPKALPMIPNG